MCLISCWTCGLRRAYGCSLFALCGRQEINRFTLFVHSTVETFLGAFDLDLWLIRSPAAANWAFVFAKDFFKQRQKPDRPAVDQRMVDKYA
jgi:hypothetical protein